MRRVQKELVCFAQKDDISSDIRRINRENGLNPPPPVYAFAHKWAMRAVANGNISVL